MVRKGKRLFIISILVSVGLFERRYMTNIEKLRTMAIEELAHEFVFWIPDNIDPFWKDCHYCGLSGSYFKTAEETIADNVVWLHEEEKLF
jgi:hypothetical protein